MPKYLVEGRYTSEGLKGLAREGSSRCTGDKARRITANIAKLLELLPKA
jgi:hypothetical protein